jgi:peptide/nickel transport system permease protein
MSELATAESASAARARPVQGTTTPAGAAALDEVEGPRPGQLAMREFLANRAAVAGTVLLLLIVGFCFIGPLVYHTDQVHTNDLTTRLAPGGSYPLGTDELGYDQLGRLMVGGRATLEVGIGAGLVAALIGTVWGGIAGYVGGTLDAAMMRFVDTMLSMPTLVLLIVLTSIVRPNVGVLIVILGGISWLVSSRLVRAETLTVKTRLYVEAFRMMGGRGVRALVRHVLPNIIGTVIVFSTFLVADSVLYVAYLSFLGLGLPPPATTWGDMLSNGTNYVYSGDWWLIYPPGVAIVLLVMSFNLMGDGLRDVFALRRAR